MKKSVLSYLVVAFIMISISSCDKGYEIRFSNYYIEPMDSVVIGNDKLVFTKIELQSTTDYRKIKKGKYSINCFTRTKKNFSSEVNIPGKGSGKRTIEIDGLSQISILEE
jgi:hypothetical protein